MVKNGHTFPLALVDYCFSCTGQKTRWSVTCHPCYNLELFWKEGRFPKHEQREHHSCSGEAWGHLYVMMHVLSALEGPGSRVPPSDQFLFLLLCLQNLPWSKISWAIVGKLGFHLLCEGIQGCVSLIYALRAYWAHPMCQPPEESWGTTAISTQEVSAPKGKGTWEDRRGPWLILRSHMRLLGEGDIEIEMWRMSRSFCPPLSHCCYLIFLYSSFIEWGR